MAMTKRSVPKSKKYPNGAKVDGATKYRGKQRWVGTFATERAWKEAERKVHNEIDAELDRGARRASEIPTVSEFAGLVVERETGRIVRRDGLPLRDTWPYTHPRKVKKESTFERYQEGIKRFIREYGDWKITEFRRVDAEALARSYGTNQFDAASRLILDAFRTHEIHRESPFKGLSSPRKSRTADPNFEIVSDAYVEKLAQAALDSCDDDYGLTLKSIIYAEADLGVRPSEIWGIEHDDVNVDEGYVRLMRQIDHKGRVTALKTEEQRLAPLTDRAIAAYLAAPRLSPRWAYPAPQGGSLYASLWANYWRPIRSLAGPAILRDGRESWDPVTRQFYSLKHRAITWMVTPKEMGGLGLPPVIVAKIVGHKDGGITIVRHYLKIDELAAVRMARDAMIPADGKRPPLRAVGE